MTIETITAPATTETLRPLQTLEQAQAELDNWHNYKATRHIIGGIDDGQFAEECRREDRMKLAIALAQHDHQGYVAELIDLDSNGAINIFAYLKKNDMVMSRRPNFGWSANMPVALTWVWQDAKNGRTMYHAYSYPYEYSKAKITNLKKNGVTIRFRKCYVCYHQGFLVEAIRTSNGTSAITPSNGIYGIYRRASFEPFNMD